MNNITTITAPATITFITIPVWRDAEHMCISAYRKDRDMSAIAHTDVELVLAFNAQQQAALVEWMEMEAQIAELESDQDYSDWLDSLEFADTVSREEMLWERFDEWWSER